MPFDTNRPPYKKRKSRFYEEPEQPLTEEQTKRVLKKMENICVWYINKSRKTRKELHDKLRERRYPQEFIEIVLDKLEASKDIDDAAYAEYFVYSRHEYDRLGKRSIENKLRMKGVSSDIIAEATENIDEDEEYENAKYLVERRLNSTRNLEPQKRLERLARFLIGKGYDLGSAFSIVKEVIAEATEAEEAEQSELESPDFTDE